MKYRYRFVDEMVDMIEGAPDPAVKMAVVFRNADNPNFKAILKIVYDYRYNFEIRNIPKYKRKGSAGIDLFTALDLLDNKLNQRLIDPKTKYNHVVSVLQMLQDRDATVLEHALSGKIKFNLDVSDIKRAVPDIASFPVINKGIAKLSDLKYPGFLLEEPLGIQIYTYVNSFGAVKFLDCKGNAYILPDKVNSTFSREFKDLRNVVFDTIFTGLTKDKNRGVSLAASQNLLDKFYEGTLEDETFQITFLDSTDYHSWSFFPEPHPTRPLLAFSRSNWLRDRKFFSPQVKIAPIKTAVDSVEEARELENYITENKKTKFRFYSNKALFSDGFHILDKTSF